MKLIIVYPKFLMLYILPDQNRLEDRVGDKKGEEYVEHPKRGDQHRLRRD